MINVRKWIMGILSLVLMLVISCSHRLAITNPDEYHASAPNVDSSIRIGIMNPQTQDAEALVNEVVDHMRAITSSKVVYPYVKSDSNPVDYILDFNIRIEYSGSPSNFLISWPGFIVLAPWWNGYIYRAHIHTKVNFFDFTTGDVLTTQSFQTAYRCKHSQLDRTWTQAVDWLLPTYSLASLIGGIFYTSYDKDITAEFVRGFSQPYGSYSARKVGSVLNSL